MTVKGVLIATSCCSNRSPLELLELLEPIEFLELETNRQIYNWQVLGHILFLDCAYYEYCCGV